MAKFKVGDSIRRIGHELDDFYSYLVVKSVTGENANRYLLRHLVGDDHETSQLHSYIDSDYYLDVDGLERILNKI